MGRELDLIRVRILSGDQAEVRVDVVFYYPCL